MDRALKYTLVTLLAIVVVVVGGVYGLYFAGARHIRDEWKPTTATYPQPARLALWRSLGGKGEPVAEPMSPIGFVWRVYRAGADQGFESTPGADALAFRTARIARLMGNRSQGDSHLMGIAAAIRASRWRVENQLDTVLDSTYFAEDVRGYRQGASYVFRRPLERLDVAQLHILMALEQGPRYLDPWCHRDRLRETALAAATRWNVPVPPQEIDAALVSIRPNPAGGGCSNRK